MAVFRHVRYYRFQNVVIEHEKQGRSALHYPLPLGRRSTAWLARCITRFHVYILFPCTPDRRRVFGDMLTQVTAISVSLSRRNL